MASRVERWKAGAEKMRKAADQIESLIEQFNEGLSEVNEVREEYEEWQGNLPENLQSSPLGEKLDEVVSIDTSEISDVSEIEDKLSEIEGFDNFPLGFGRD